jgi:hypothetical protein
MTTSNKQKIDLAAALSENLAFRQNADRIFDELCPPSYDEITLDFGNVATMSRSFAHQYLLRKSKSEKRFHEVGMSDNVKKMLELAGNRKPKIQLVDFHAMRTITL